MMLNISVGAWGTC